MNCACMSVGKPGCGCGRDVGRAGARPAAHAHAAALGGDLDARRAQLGDDRLEVLGQASRSSTSPRVIAAATSNVPASMRSGMIACSIGCSSSTPSIVMSGVPAPRTRAPILLSTRAELLDLGLARRVLEHGAALRASAAAIIRFSRAGDGRHVEDDRGAAQPPALARRRSRARASILRAHRLQALEVLIDRARADRAAARQRHARAAVARDQRPEHQHGRAHRLDQLVGRLDSVTDADGVDARDAAALVARTRRPGARAASPSCARRPARGRCGRSSGPRASSDDARIGSAAFLEPETRTSPCRRAPPRMTIFCKDYRTRSD